MIPSSREKCPYDSSCEQNHERACEKRTDSLLKADEDFAVVNGPECGDLERPADFLVGQVKSRRAYFFLVVVSLV